MRHVLHPGGPGRPALLIMGLGMPGQNWDEIVERLTPFRPVVTFDHRGAGDSAGSPRSSMAELVADTLEVWEAANLDRAHVVGVSMGGMIAQELALAHPERVLALVLIATHAGGPLALWPPWAGLRALAIRDPVRRLERLLHPAPLRTALRARSTRTAALLAPPATRRAHLRAVARHDTRARLAAIRAPTLVVRPDQDALIRPGHSDRLAAAIPGARLLARPDAGHGLVVHDADALAAAIDQHLSAHDGR